MNYSDDRIDMSMYLWFSIQNNDINNHIWYNMLHHNHLFYMNYLILEVTFCKTNLYNNPLDYAVSIWLSIFIFVTINKSSGNIVFFHLNTSHQNISAILSKLRSFDNERQNVCHFYLFNSSLYSNTCLVHIF